MKILQYLSPVQLIQYLKSLIGCKVATCTPRSLLLHPDGISQQACFEATCIPSPPFSLQLRKVAVFDHENAEELAKGRG